MADTPMTQQQMSPVQANSYARNLILSRSQLCTLQLPSKVVTAADLLAGGNTISITPQNVGLVKGFWVNVTGSVTNTAAAGAGDATRTGRGYFNVIRNIKYTDLLNNERVNCSGFYLALMNSAKIGWGFGGDYDPQLPNGVGELNFPVQTGDAVVADDSGVSTFNVWYYLPLAYSVQDTTGAVFAQTTGGTQNIEIQLNTQIGFTTGDSLYAIAGGAGSVLSYTSGSSVTVNVFQDYWGQLPYTQQNGQLSYIVPTLDIGTSYVLNQTVQAGPTAGQDFPLQIPNYRKFLSVMAIYDNFNSGTPNGEAAFGTGTDITNWKLLAANYTPIRQWTPNLLAVQNRNTLMGDMPLGSYLFDFRQQPLDSAVYGNLQISMLPSTVNSSSAYVYYGFEAFADSAIVTQAGSLPAS